MPAKLIVCDLEGTRCRTCRKVIPVGDEMLAIPTGSRAGARWWRQCLDCHEAQNERAQAAIREAQERRGDLLPESFAARSGSSAASSSRRRSRDSSSLK